MLSSLIEKFSRRVRAKADQRMQVEAQEFRSDIQDGWPIATPISRGSRAAWVGPFKVAEGHYRLINPFPYAGVIEYGGYPSPGPKTAQQGGQMLPGGIQIGGGVYPTQRPAAPVRQAMSKRKLKWAKVGIGVK
jgi:hypothetical protein